MGCASSQEASEEMLVDIEFQEVSTGWASPVAWEDVQCQGVMQLSHTSTALASPVQVSDMSTALVSWESADRKNSMDSMKGKKVRFDEVSMHDVHLKQCAGEHKVHLRDPMTCGTMEDFRTFVETFPKTLEMKVELKRYRDFGRPKTRAKSS